MEYKWNARAVSTKGTIGNGTAQFLFPFIGITVTRSSLQNIVAGTLLGVIPRRAPNVDHAYQTSHRKTRECRRTTSEKSDKRWTATGQKNEEGRK